MLEENYYHILIVDDVKAVASSLRRELTLTARKNNIKFKISDYQDPEDGFLFIDSNHVDLVISDIKMPYMTGDKLIEKIKEKFPQMPVIVITGYATKENIMSVMKADKNCRVLTKPWDLEKLIEAVAGLLKISLLPPADYD